MLPGWQTKLSHLDKWIRPQTTKTFHTTGAQSKTLKNKYQMLLTVPWGILILGEIARGMFCIIKSNYIISCNSFWINREKLGDNLKWTDYRSFCPATIRNLLASRVRNTHYSRWSPGNHQDFIRFSHGFYMLCVRFIC